MRRSILKRHRSTVRRRTVTGAALSVLLVAAGFGAAGELPASAAPAHPAPASKAPASDAVLTAMQKDLGLTRTQATARLAAETKARSVQRAARRAAGAAYGGAWFDAQSGSLTVALADRAEAAAVRATGAHVKLVEHTEKQLDAAKKKIDALKAPTGVADWRTDPETNKVVVDVVAGQRSDNDVRTFLAKAKDLGPVTVENTAARPRTLAAGTVGGDAWYTGNVRCSIGFSVIGGFVSAGHCGQAGQSVSGWDGSYIGHIQGSTFPGNDWSWTNVDPSSGWWTVAVVLGWGTVSDQLVQGSAEAPIGASICRSGSTSHWHCGNIQATNVTVNYSEGAVYSMTQTSVCAEPGDSGGSYISGDQAQGVTSGGSGDCTSGGTTFFQPINPILSHFGLTLQTFG